MACRWCWRILNQPLAALVASALLPATAVRALELVQSPPGNQSPYVAPNVILSLDDSGSMDNPMTQSGSGRRRIEILKEALKVTFKDKELLPDGKIRLA